MRRCITALVLSSVMLTTAMAGETRARFAVTAYVVPHASIESYAQPSRFSVSAGDIERGYVDLAAVYRISSNGASGYVVRLAPRVGLTRAIEVSGLSSSVVVHDEVVEVSQPALRRPQDLRLSFRLLLGDAAIPGTYAWPVQLEAYAL